MEPHRLFLLALCAAGLATGAVFMMRLPPAEPVATKIDDEVSITRLPDDVIVVVGPKDALHVSRLREPKAPPPAMKGATPTALRWTLPYSCADVRYYERTFTKVQLDAMRKAAGIRLPTPAEKQQIAACLQGRLA